MKPSKNILVAVLNWGLGHATRCIPIVNELERQGANVVLASDGDALLLLQQEYPHLKTIELPAYNIHYKGDNMFLNMAPQVPKILKAIRLERKKLDSIIEEYEITTIISDNRYGMYHRTIFSVFLTHQLNIQVPNKWVESMLAKCNHYFIRKFDQCWVPDHATEPSLAGNLAHDTQLKNLCYLGPLSRMSKLTKKATKQDVIAVLSGPEPQRTYLEEKIITQAKALPYQFLIVGGKPKTMEKKDLAPNIQWQSFMDADALQMAIAESNIVLARSGYSTVMDLVTMGCQKVLLIPTPGQSEQEYLARRLAEKGLFLTENQSTLNLERSINSLMKKGAIPFAESSGEQLKTTILNCINRNDSKI
ncbi:MAG: hypothetical protein JKY03_04840 [Aureispira sp.]|nr:hypothetical protein [Aureispira sp.]